MTTIPHEKIENYEKLLFFLTFFMPHDQLTSELHFSQMSSLQRVQVPRQLTWFLWDNLRIRENFIGSYTGLQPENSSSACFHCVPHLFHLLDILALLSLTSSSGLRRDSSVSV